MPVLERGLTSRVLCHPGHGSPGNLSASEACSPVQTPSPCQEQSCLYGTRLPFHLQAKAAVGALMGCKEASCPNWKNLTGSLARLGRLWVCQQVSEKQVPRKSSGGSGRDSSCSPDDHTLCRLRPLLTLS